MLKLRRGKTDNHPKTVLIVDDDSAIREAILHRLEGSPWTVMTATDGQEALERVAEHKPDLVLLDIKMPGVDGRAVLEHLKRDADTADIKVIMVTASQHVSDITWAASYAVQEYITKPFYPADVVSRITRVLSTTEQ